MNWFSWVKVVCVMPVLWVDSFCYKNKSFSDRYLRLKWWAKQLIRAMDLRVEVKLSQPYSAAAKLILCNHQGTFDPLYTIVEAPFEHTYISKVENMKLPVIGRWAKLIDMIAFDRESVLQGAAMLKRSAKTLKEGRSLLVFPEVTRSRGSQMNVFKVGAVLPAYLAKSSIVIMAIDQAYQRKNPIRVIWGKEFLYEDYRHIEKEVFIKQLEEEVKELKNSLFV